LAVALNIRDLPFVIRHCIKGGTMPTTLNVNGREHAVAAPAGASLLAVLRDELDLTGAKYGCGEGQCGACTVLVDGKAVRSCITELSECAG
jgi:aerobic-type carbon monoxide dehydrogenase small subunit (CoxS/CutS family)